VERKRRDRKKRGGGAARPGHGGKTACAVVRGSEGAKQDMNLFGCRREREGGNVYHARSARGLCETGMLLVPKGEKGRKRCRAQTKKGGGEGG